MEPVESPPTGAPLTNHQRRRLAGLAQTLKPVVMIGERGVTDAVVAELDRALTAQELVKVKINVGERPARKAALQALGEQTGAAVVQAVGRTGVLFRRNPDAPRITL